MWLSQSYLVLALLLSACRASVKLDVTLQGYTYYMNVSISSVNDESDENPSMQVPMIIDTSTPFTIFKLNPPDLDRVGANYSAPTACDQAKYPASLFIDTTGLGWDGTCIDGITTNVSLVTDSEDVTVTVTDATSATEAAIENEDLHSFDANPFWGLLGMNYDTSSTFRTLLSKVGDNVFALDFRDENSPSSIELGGYDQTYNLTWFQQPVQDPVYHMATIEGLSLCGVDLSGNWTDSWSVLVDTSASCLTLPDEPYKALKTWLSSSGMSDADIENAPPLSFTLPGEKSPLYVRLSDLVVEAGVLDEETSPPKTLSGKRFCILNNGVKLVTNQGRAFTWSHVTFGSLVLRSLYFVADYDHQKIGLANKGVFPSTSDVSQAGSCAAPKQCIGEERYVKDENRCNVAPCKEYFFLDRDDDTMKCVWRSPAHGMGVFFVIVLLIVEMVTFFVSHYTAASITNRKVDTISFAIGKALTPAFDALVVYMTPSLQQQSGNLEE